MAIIQFCLAIKLTSSTSFRAINQIIVVLNIYLNLSLKVPTHATILLWVKKYGYFKLNTANDFANDWVIILDESVQFGQNRLLLVYGIRQSKIDFTRPLNYKDLTPLSLISKSSWKGDDIKGQLEDIEKKVGRICYAVADYGNPIKKAIKMLDIPHVYDITHCISLILEHIYKEDQEFKEYTKQLAHLRGAQSLGKMSHVLPPAQRASARFMNLKPISDWGVAVLKLLDDRTDGFIPEKENLKWVDVYGDLIKELALLNQTINKIQLILKTSGLSKTSVEACIGILSKGTTKRFIQFKQEMIKYFNDVLSTSKFDQVLCCSDIIESSFGKYKNYLQANPMIGITNLSLSLAAFTGSLASEEIMEAFQTTQVNDIKKWTETNIGQTTLSKRLNVFKGDEKKC